MMGQEICMLNIFTFPHLKNSLIKLDQFQQSCYNFYLHMSFSIKCVLATNYCYIKCKLMRSVSYFIYTMIEEVIMAFQKDYTVCHNHFHTVQCPFIQDVFHVHSFNKIFDFHIYFMTNVFSHYFYAQLKVFIDNCTIRSIN